MNQRCKDQSLQVLRLPEPDHWLQILRSQVRWRSETITLFGRQQPVPRQVAWYGAAGLSYRYSGIAHSTAGWPKHLAELNGLVKQLTGANYNFVLLNRYRDGSDSMGWHADDEPELLGDVCSVSLGAARRFLIEPRHSERRTLTLYHGDLVMIPRHWRHCVPKTRKPVAERINLSFRCLR